MHWPSYVEKTFYKFCEHQKNCPPELMSALRKSDRTKAFLKNLTVEISKAEKVVHSRRGKPLKLVTIQSCIWDMAKLLLRGIENEANNRVKSEVQRSKEKAEADYLKDLEATIDGKPQGDFEGLEIVESETKETTEKRRENGASY